MHAPSPFPQSLEMMAAASTEIFMLAGPRLKAFHTHSLLQVICYLHRVSVPLATITTPPLAGKAMGVYSAINSRVWGLTGLLRHSTTRGHVQNGLKLPQLFPVLVRVVRSASSHISQSSQRPDLICTRRYQPPQGANIIARDRWGTRKPLPYHADCQDGWGAAMPALCLQKLPLYWDNSSVAGGDFRTCGDVQSSYNAKENRALRIKFTKCRKPQIAEGHGRISVYPGTVCRATH